MLDWKIEYPNGDTIMERHPIQDPPVAESFVINLQYRDTKIREAHPGCKNVWVCNPAAPDRWHSYVDNRGVYGMMKRLYRQLVFEPCPKCPHCGKPLGDM
jgi:hypothetical protein